MYVDGETHVGIDLTIYETGAGRLVGLLTRICA